MQSLGGLLWQSVHAKFNKNPSIGENSIRRQIFGPKRDEITEEWSRLRKKDKIE